MIAETYFPSHFGDSSVVMAKMKSHSLMIAVIFMTLGVNGGSDVDNKENILIVVVDDLRPLAGCGAHARAPASALAGSAVTFKRAYAQQALCAPSRNSMLTGRRPDTLHLYDFYTYWRESSGNFTTMPQFFKERGYKSYSFGKVFHPGKSSNFTDDFPYSWSDVPYHPSTQAYKDAKVCMDEETGKLGRNLVCPVDLRFQPEGTLPDIQIAEAGIQKLKYHRDMFNSTPFFMAIGFTKPHIPLKFPKKFLDYYPLNNISLPEEPFRPPGMPTVAWNPFTDVRDRDDIKKLKIPFPFGTMPEKWTLKIKQSYCAAVQYIDELIGKVLEHINMDDTIIVITSDHGWSLGEHGEWAKYSNFDVSLKVPLIIHVPGLTNTNTSYKSTNAVVELVDIFPTLADITGNIQELPECKKDSKIIACSEGFSLYPLIKSVVNNGTYKWGRAAFSQYPRPSINPTVDSDKPRLNQIKVMGYTMRTKRYRYTEWVNFNNTSFEPNWNGVIATECYDHKIDQGENLNLADRTILSKIIKRLRFKLRNGWRIPLKPANTEFYQIAN